MLIFVSFELTKQLCSKVFCEVVLKSLHRHEELGSQIMIQPFTKFIFGVLLQICMAFNYHFHGIQTCEKS